MEDAPEDRDIKMQKLASEFIVMIKDLLGKLLFDDDAGLAGTSTGTSRTIRRKVSIDDVGRCVVWLEQFQENPQTLDPHLATILPPLLSSLLTYLTAPPTTTPTARSYQTLPEGIARILYTLCKVRGHKVISRFFPNEPHLLQFIVTRFSFAKTGEVREEDVLEKAVANTWELRYIILLWLSLLLLTPFDLSTISAVSPSDVSTQNSEAIFIPLPNTPFPGKLASLPQLCKTLLQFAIKILPSPSPRESDAAALLIVRLAIRKDMLDLGVLDAVVAWCLQVWAETKEDQDIELLSCPIEDNANPLFLRTGTLKIIAGLLSQLSRTWMKRHISKIWALVTLVEDKGAEQQGEIAEGTDTATPESEWASTGVRRVITKIYRWIGMILLTPGTEDEEGIVENVVGRLLNLLGDRDTNVRFAASKSLGVLTSRLPPEMAKEVVNAVVAGYDENVLYEHEEPESVTKVFGDDVTSRRKQILASVSPEMWHGLTLTLATLLRQRAIVPVISGDEEEESTKTLFQAVILRILTALTFDQRRATFSVGSNVRDAANYAAWSLARAYQTKELLAIPLPHEHYSHPFPPTAGIENIIQLLATNLVAAACLDTLGNIRRGASAALQELVGRHPNVVIAGINLIQAVDYASVSVRRRAVTEVAKAAAQLGECYWFALVKHGLVDGWRGVGNVDIEGRRVAAKGLGGLVQVRVSQEEEPDKRIVRGKKVVGWLLSRGANDGTKDVEIRHGVYWALAEVLEGLANISQITNSTESGYDPSLFTTLQQDLIFDIFHPLQGKDFVRLISRPELTAEASCRLASSLCKVSYRRPSFSIITPILPPLPLGLQRLSLAIVETSLDHRSEDQVLEEAISAAKDLFNVLSLKNQTNVVEGWCRRVMAENVNAPPAATFTAQGTQFGGGSGLGRKRGLVGGLGEVLGVLLEEEEEEVKGAEEEICQQYNNTTNNPTSTAHVVSDVTDVLVDAATRKGDVEMRVAGTRAITRGIMSQRHCGYNNIVRHPSIIHALYEGLDDYAVDSRGDVGSWVRMDCIKAISLGWQSGALNFDLKIPEKGRGKQHLDGENQEEVMTGLLTRLLRLSVEKLDKLRIEAFQAIRLILFHEDYRKAQQSGKKNTQLTQPSSISQLGALIDWFKPADVYSTTTSRAYFTALLPVVVCPWKGIVEEFIAGYVMSAGAGTDSLLRTANRALWTYLYSDNVTLEQLCNIADTFVTVLDRSIKDSSERITVPCLQTIGWGLETGVLNGEKAYTWGVEKGGWKKLFMTVQNAHKGSGNVGKLSASVRIYRGLGLAGGNGERAGEIIRGLVIRKLVGMLAHPFPKIRQEVAEGLYLVVTTVGKGGEVEGVLEETDWMGKEVKGKMGMVKKLLLE